MPQDSDQVVFAQFTRYIIETTLDTDDWKLLAAEHGVTSLSKRVERFFPSWNWSDEDRTQTTQRFLELVKEGEGRDTAYSIMRRAVSLNGGIEDEQENRYPALRVLTDDEDSKDIGLSPTPVHSGDFISVNNIPGTFYPDLIEDINQCYRIGVYDATMVLSRKLIENLLIDILRTQYGTDQIGLYYIPGSSRFHSLDDLVKNFESVLSDFEHYGSGVDQGLIRELHEFRKKSSAEAHSIDTNISRSEIKDYGEKAESLAKLLIHMLVSIS